ncbi:MAG: DUF695 domain-containing protein, partial [Bacteroidota bacterium]
MNFLKKIFNKADKKEAQITSYAEFWQWFAEHEAQFYQVIKAGKRIPEDFINPVHDQLNELRPECFFLLTGMHDEATAELVFSAEGVAKNVVFVDDLVANAPEIENWKFTALKPAIDFKDMGIKMAEIEFSAKKIKF